MRRLFAVLALLFAVSLPISAQFTKPEMHYVFGFAGASKINGLDAGYSSLSVAVMNETFVVGLAPFVAQWSDSSTRFSGAIDAAIKTPKVPLHLGIGKMIGSNGTNTYGTLSWWGSNTLPTMLRLGIGKDYFAATLAFHVKR